MSPVKQLKSGDTADDAHNVGKNYIARNNRPGHDIAKVYVATVHDC